MSQPVYLVTGATSGIGFATARRLATQGATVVLAGRTRARCEAAAERLRSDAGNRADVDWLAAELSRPAEIRSLADEFRRRYDRLDVLVNNAAMIPSRRMLTPEGIELTLAVNHLAPFMLTMCLLDVLAASAPAREITVTSGAHERARLDFSDLQLAHHFLPFRAYARSKLANLLFTYELARRLDGTGVTANAVNPGLVRTELGKGNGPLRDLAWHLTHLRHRAVSMTPDHAAEAIHFLACSPAMAQVTGGYFTGAQPADSSPASHDHESARRLWALSERWTGTEGLLERATALRSASAPSGRPD